jgi:tetratricopeptide (TPR) repeat protein
MVVLAVAVAGAGVFVARAQQPAPATAPVAAAAVPSPAAATPAPSSGARTAPKAGAGSDAAAAAPTDEQLAAVASALTQVRDHPRNVPAHLDLARAYADAGQAQLSAVEYLAVLQLDKANPEANTALALVALAAGRPAEGKKLVDTVLAKHPRYPDALYARGLIYVMGLRQVAPGVRDLRTYLKVAPYGAHGPTVRTLLAMVPKDGSP